MSLVFKQKVDGAIGIPFLTLCALLVLESTVLWILGCVGKLFLPFQKTIRFILGGLILFGVLRFVTSVLWIVPQSDPVYNQVLNRLSWLVFTITFMLLLFGWIEAIHVKYPPPTDRLVPIVGRTFIVVALLLVIELLVAGGVWLGFRTNKYQAPKPLPAEVAEREAVASVAYDVHIYIYGITQFLLGLGFLIYGIVLVWRLRQHGPKTDSRVSVHGRGRAKQTVMCWKILVVGIVFFVCFSLKFVMFLYRPITSKYLPNGVFYTFAYIVPEIVPCIVQLFIIISTHDSKKRQHGEMSKKLSSPSDSPMEMSSSQPAVPLLSHTEDEDESFVMPPTNETEEELHTLRETVDNYQDIVEEENALVDDMDEEAAEFVNQSNNYSHDNNNDNSPEDFQN